MNDADFEDDEDEYEHDALSQGFTNMRTRHLLTALAAWATLGLTSVMAQQPNLLPPGDGGTVVSDRVVEGDSREIAHHGDGGSVGGGPGMDGGMGPLPYNGYPYNGAWHAGYQHPMFGGPVALVVPPVAHYQTIYGWGIGATQVTPIYPQFGGPGYGTPYGGAGEYQYPPYWPWDTRQFGVYYVRGPW